MRLLLTWKGVSNQSVRRGTQAVDVHGRQAVGSRDVCWLPERCQFRSICLSRTDAGRWATGAQFASDNPQFTRTRPSAPCPAGHERCRSGRAGNPFRRASPNLDGSTYTVDEALKEMPLPNRACTHLLHDPERGFCRCLYVAQEFVGFGNSSVSGDLVQAPQQGCAQMLLVALCPLLAAIVLSLW